MPGVAIRCPLPAQSWLGVARIEFRELQRSAVTACEARLMVTQPFADDSCNCIWVNGLVR